MTCQDSLDNLHNPGVLLGTSAGLHGWLWGISALGGGAVHEQSEAECAEGRAREACIGGGACLRVFEVRLETPQGHPHIISLDHHIFFLTPLVYDTMWLTCTATDRW